MQMVPWRRNNIPSSLSRLIKFDNPVRMNRTLLISCLVIAFGAAPDGHARLTKAWRYQEMFDQADLVVIARVVATQDTDERSTLVTLNVVGVITDFRTHLVLKGDRGIKTFQLHHYRLQNPRDEETVANGPNLVSFSRQGLPCLLFLVKESDGRYAPVTGQEDPALHSVLELGGIAD